uniref:Squalene-hopene/tetraprenyl-beta-curcumene cyclase n=1 Tax=Candidatus Kentrum sp. SD TaxID=2126332 RepID=A0A450Z5K7_9GAMM|nr:MAG: squalene-hopene/tetraprenyl-beta-curcumene cyclase [Candidatus Kentron sp. SD]VFK49085.1 MAG: squalene-hopene/tetraprenyl-beta-curcumene cyclase [Candidatus Kentron sp. SD]
MSRPPLTEIIDAVLESHERIVPFEKLSLQSPWKEAVRASVDKATCALLALQHPDGYWCFELEADDTIPAEYILMMHFMNEIDEKLQARLANYIRSIQQPGGGWPLYYRGFPDISCTVKSYYALKLAGDDPGAPHMRKARGLILRLGGAARCNVFTRLMLAMFEQIPWRGVPYIPAEIILLPKWFFFHLDKVSYWTRTVLVPLTILYTLRAKAENPNRVHVQELFTVDPEKERKYFPIRSPMNRVFLILERTARRFDWIISKAIRNKAIKRAEDWFIERLNGGHGLGAIFPAMVNAHEALKLLGHGREHPLRKQTKAALEALLVERGEGVYCQPCVSPVWDTALTALALLETRDERTRKPIKAACDWLVRQQVTDEPGDWRIQKPDVPGGGWAFQFQNPHYPDLDDTAVVGWAMRDHDPAAYKDAMDKAAVWVAGLQSRNGGFASFDADNTHYILNEIPFADHGALLDPPTSDVTARCITFLSRYHHEKYRSVIEKALRFLETEQEESGAWFGRWGTNYIYGTWSVLVALENADIDPNHPMIRRAVAWLVSKQNKDGGWGETNDSYETDQLTGIGERSTAFQTAWALLGLMSAGEVNSHEVKQGVEYLLHHQEEDGLWRDPEFTAPGFPRVFYLKYHGYDDFFPLWALARYRRLASETSQK